MFLEDENAVQAQIALARRMLPPGYKVVKAGDGKVGRKKGTPQSPETRAKISKAMTGRKLSAETRRKISEARLYGYSDRVQVIEEEVRMLKQQLARRG
jgi:hypothetical protein